MKPVVVLLAVVACVAAIDGHWSQDDTQRLGKVLQNSLASKKADISALHFAASGLKLLKIEAPSATAQAACDVAKKASLTDLKSLYHAASLSGDLTNCALGSLTGAKETIDATLKSASAEDIYMALQSADRLAIKVDKAAFDAALTATLKDTSVANSVAAINAASLLDKAQAAKYLKTAALVSQADLVDKKYLQFEGGVSLTASAVHGLIALATQQGKASGISKEQLVQFSNFLVSRKHVSSERDAFNLLTALGSLANNQFEVPVIVVVDGPSAAESGKSVKVHISNIFGLPIAATTVKANLSPVGGKGAAVQAIPLTKSDAQGVLYDLPLDKVTESGFYVASVTIESQDKRLVGLTGNNLKLKIVQEITVEDVKVAILEKDSTPSGSDLHSIAKFSKHGSVLTADHTKRLFASFALKTKNGAKPISAHQVFVVFTHSTGAEVIFTADAQGSGVFTVDINLAKSHKDFDDLSGKYTARLVVGDALIKTPIDWAFADYSISLPAGPVVVVPKSERVNYEPLKEIVHQFRQPEKRPPVFVSGVFTVVCVVPLLLLLVLWARIGINFGNMPASPWVLVFHGGLAALFGLYFVFWLQLDMFETLKYLAIVGSVTFLAGNRLLRSIADQRKAKAE